MRNDRKADPLSCKEPFASPYEVAPGVFKCPDAMLDHCGLEEGRRRAAYAVRVVAHMPRCSERLLAEIVARVAAELHDPAPPVPSTVRRWARVYGRRRSVLDLCPMHWKKGSRQPKLPERVRETMAQAVRLSSLPGQSVVLAEVRTLIAHLLNEFNRQHSGEPRLVPPSTKTIRRFLDRRLR